MSDILKRLVDSAIAVVNANGGTRLNGEAASNRTKQYTEQVMTETCRRLHTLGYLISDVSALQPKHIEAIVVSWHRQGMSNKTMQNQYSRLKIFCGWIGKAGLMKQGGVSNYLPHVDPAQLKVNTVALKSKSWSENGIDLDRKLRQAIEYDQRHGMMLLLGIAFGLRKKEMLRIKIWKADKGGSVDIDQNIAKNGRFRSIPIEDGDFGKAQRWVLERVKSVCKKSEMLNWPGLTLLQGENRYYQRMKYLGITKFDSGVTGHGLRAEYAENLLALKGLIPPTLGGTKDQMDKKSRDKILLEVQNALGHGDLHTASAYFGSFMSSKGDKQNGPQVGSTLVVDDTKDVFARMHIFPGPVKQADGSYPPRSKSQRAKIRVTFVVESPLKEDEQLALAEFIDRFPHLADKVKIMLTKVGLGEYREQYLPAALNLLSATDCFRRQSGRPEFQIQRLKADIAPAYEIGEEFASLQRLLSLTASHFAASQCPRLSITTAPQSSLSSAAASTQMATLASTAPLPGLAMVSRGVSGP